MASVQAAVSATTKKNLPPPPPPPPPPSHNPSRAMKLEGGVNKEVLDSLAVGRASDTKNHAALLPPIVPTFTIKVGNKFISSAKPCRKWEWAPFKTSSRGDGQEFRHWVRAGLEYPDYPYARFDVHLDPIQYSAEEYRKFLSDANWTKSDTDKLMELGRVFELRWAVIYDRWSEFDRSERKIEDLQHRFYHVAATLAQVRISKEAAVQVNALTATGDNSEQVLLEAAAARALMISDLKTQPFVANVATGSSNKQVFDLKKERERRTYMKALWNRTKAEELEEQELRKELQHIETQLRKLKKSGGHVLAARSASPVPVAPTAAMLDKAFTSTAPTPMPETPYLQSGRLAAPAVGGPLGINKTTLKRMETVLEELKVAHKLSIPTKRVCDLYDSVRKDILTLLTLQKICLQKEGQLQTKRLRLSKLGGKTTGRVMDEEALMGITPAPAPAPPPAPRAKPKAKPKSAAGKAAATKSTKASKSVGDGDTTKAKKPATKKRKKAATTDASKGSVSAPVAPTAATSDEPPKPASKKRRKSQQQTPAVAPAP